jgi:hypothetical protein
MSSLGALLIIVTGLVVMALGLFLFYAWLPFLYGFVGLDIGLMLGRWLTGDIGAIAIILGVIGAIVLAFASYTLEPYRRILLGVSAGVFIGLALAAAFGVDGFLGTFIGGILAVVLGLIGGSVVPRYFDLFVIFATSISGASMIMAGAHILAPNMQIFDVINGGIAPSILAIVLAAAGVVWQFRNIGKWITYHAVNPSGSELSPKTKI